MKIVDEDLRSVKIHELADVSLTLQNQLTDLKIISIE